MSDDQTQAPPDDGPQNLPDGATPVDPDHSDWQPDLPDPDSPEWQQQLADDSEGDQDA